MSLARPVRRRAETLRFTVGPQQTLDLGAQVSVISAGCVQVGGLLGRRFVLQRFAEDGSYVGLTSLMIGLLIDRLPISAPSAPGLRRAARNFPKKVSPRTFLGRLQPFKKPGPGERPVPVGRPPGIPSAAAASPRDKPAKNRRLISPAQSGTRGSVFRSPHPTPAIVRRRVESDFDSVQR